MSTTERTKKGAGKNVHAKAQALVVFDFIKGVPDCVPSGVNCCCIIGNLLLAFDNLGHYLGCWCGHSASYSDI